MPKEIELRLFPQEAKDEELLLVICAKKLKADPSAIQTIQVFRRSIDARGHRPKIVLGIRVWWRKETVKSLAPELSYSKVAPKAKEVIIVGAGPSGYFAALELIRNGVRPIVLERGKDVRSRRKDLRAIQQYGQVDPDSNYCFGEGGAGTYSDGKLYTRSNKRGNVKDILQTLVHHGAQEDILVDAHPHIGSNRLPKVVSNIRKTILEKGGEVHFESRVTDLLIQNNQITGVIVNNEIELQGEQVILATGHSARDIFHLLRDKDIHLERKSFALGVRIEHPQALIDQIQYGRERGEHLPAAAYSLTCQVEDRGVFSFCMCPGGLVVPAATAPGEIVMNGMSLSRRDSPFANSGTVVTVEEEDLLPFKEHGVFAGLEFQKSVEKAMFNQAGDGSQKAPSQRLTDFVAGKTSSSLPDSSYIPGLVSAPVHDLLPSSIYTRIKGAVKHFDRKMKGYFSAETNVIGTESRTSSPIRIPREKESYEHVQIKGLYPCGEGAGYAGGIMSAAIDGQNVAKAIVAKIK